MAAAVQSRFTLLAMRHVCCTLGRVIDVELGVSERVIKRRLNNIYEKLGVSSRVEALARARSLGISLGDG